MTQQGGGNFGSRRCYSGIAARRRPGSDRLVGVRTGVDVGILSVGIHVTVGRRLVIGVEIGRALTTGASPRPVFDAWSNGRGLPG
jgi:hypothetical protein